MSSESWEVFYSKFITAGGWKTVLSGLGATVQIAVLGLLIGIAIGTVIAISKVVPNRNNPFVRIWSFFNDVYVWLFRGTPVVVQLLLMHFAVFPLINLKIGSVNEAVLIFGLNSGAYVSEIMRSGIMSVDKGHMEAGRSLGMSYVGSMFGIVLPQAVKNILPTIGNEFIALVKETSVVSFIAVVDLTKAFKSIGDSNYDYFLPYIFLALVYLLIVTLITLLVRFTEKQLRKSDARQDDGDKPKKVNKRFQTALDNYLRQKGTESAQTQSRSSTSTENAEEF